MRIKETKVYEFLELSEDVKEKAIEKLWDINVDDSWWYESVYANAENIGLKITSFDLDYKQIKGKFVDNPQDVAKKIIAEHGLDCETRKTAENYLEEVKKEMAKNLEENKGEEYPEDCLDTEEIDGDFLQSLLEDYRIILQHELDYLTSTMAIIETIEANEYEFDENGNLA